MDLAQQADLSNPTDGYRLASPADATVSNHIPAGVVAAKVRTGYHVDHTMLFA
jgi:hypothetical protein